MHRLSLVVTYALYYSQVLVSRLFFLQKFGKVFGINNRYHIHSLTQSFSYVKVVVEFDFSILLPEGNVKLKQIEENNWVQAGAMPVCFVRVKLTL